MNEPSSAAQGFTSSSALGSGNGPARGGAVSGTRGRTNGLVNGIGRTNGLVNGVGRTNGLVNGIGRTNGLGNGVRPPDGRSARTRFRSVTRRDIRAAYAIFGTSVAIMLILSFLLATPAPPRPAYIFAVDGNFAEWQQVPINVDPPNSGPGEGDLLAYAVHAEASQLFVYAPGALAINESPLTNVVSGATPVLQLKFRALATDIRVDRVSLDLVGAGSVQPLPLPLWITAGQEVTQTVILDPGSAPAGQFITLQVGAVTAVSTINGTVVPTTISGLEARVYVQALPTGKTIDGVFNDWTNTTLDPIDPVPASLDIRASAMSVPGSGYFYVETRGPILEGSILPERRLIASWR